MGLVAARFKTTSVVRGEGAKLDARAAHANGTRHTHEFGPKKAQIICSESRSWHLFDCRAGVATEGHALSPQFLAYLVISCFERRCPKYCCSPKVKSFGPPKILAWTTTGLSMDKKLIFLCWRKRSMIFASFFPQSHHCFKRFLEGFTELLEMCSILPQHLSFSKINSQLFHL